MKQQSGQPEQYIYFQTHWDREWYEPFRTYQLRLSRVVDDILDRLDRNILPCFTLDGQTVLLDDYLELRPENRDRIRRYVESGQLSIGPWFVMPDEFLVSGESLVENLRMGILASRGWGCMSFTGYLPDTFGHSADIPMILSQCGIESAVIWRGVNPKNSVFQWQSPAGASILAYHLVDGYFQMMFQDVDLSDPEKQKSALQLALKARQSAGNRPSLLPIGGDHLGPVTGHAKTLLDRVLPDAIPVNVDGFMAALAGSVNGSDLPVIAGELTDNTGQFILPGVWSARLYLKQQNRRLEHRLAREAEPLSLLASTLTDDFRYPEAELALAWRTLLLNHPHDSICGCSVDEVHRENEVRFDQVREIVDDLSHQARHQLASTLAGPDQWLVVNMGSRPYTGLLRVSVDADQADQLHQPMGETIHLVNDYLHDTQQVPLSHKRKTTVNGYLWVENISALGVKVVNTGRLSAPDAVTATENSLENACLKVVVEDDGTLSVADKATGRAHRGLHRIIDRPDQGDSYNFAPVPGSEFQQARLKKVYAMEPLGPLKGSLMLRYELPGLEPLQTLVTLKAGSRQLEFETFYTNQAANHRLQAAFDTGKPVSAVLAESHFGTVERQYDPDYDITDHMPAPAWTELKTNTGPIQRFVAANGHAWITEGLTEYEVAGSELRLTLLRAFNYLSKPDTGVRGAPAGPPFMTTEGECLGRAMLCRYAWLPEPGRISDLFAEADVFYGAVWAMPGRAKTPVTTARQLVQLDNDQVIVTRIQQVQEGISLRLLNPTETDQAVTLKPGFAYKTAWRTNFLHEDRVELPGLNLVPEIMMSPGAVMTVLFSVE